MTGDVRRQHFNCNVRFIRGSFSRETIDITNLQVAFQSNVNHPLAESMGYIQFEGM